MHALIIDDEEALGRAIHRFVSMARPSWDVYHTADPTEGRTLLVMDPRILVAFVDVLMPGLAGDTLIMEALVHRPELRGRIIVCSAMEFRPGLEEKLFGELGCIRMDKPFALEEVEIAILKATGGA